MKCPNCPLRDAAVECPAIALPHPRFCQLVDPGHPDYRPEYAAIVAARAGAAPVAPGPPIAGAVEHCAGCEPSLARKAVNLGRAVAQHVAAGLPKVDEATYRERLAVCQGCDQFTAQGHCRVCGCVMARKAWWAEQRCPLSKWPGETPVVSANPEMDWARGGS